MTQAKIGDTVSVHYTGKLADGSIFDTSVGEEPLVVTLGEGELIEGFEEGLLSMSVGEKKTLILTPEKAYGEYHDDMLMVVPLADLPDDLEPAVGDELELIGEDGESLLVVVSHLSDDSVTLDGNPPFAGETLTFELELVAIK